MSSKKFFFDPADGKNFSTQGDFASHGDIAAYRNTRQSADNGIANRDACGRPVLGDGAFGNVYVNIDVAIKILRQPKRRGSRANVAHRRLSGFLHHVTELASEREAAFAFH